MAADHPGGTTADILSRASLGFVHAMKGDGNAALHFCSGDLRQILSIEDEQVRWSLGARSRHNGQQHSCGHIGLSWNNFYHRCKCIIKYTVSLMVLTYHHLHQPPQDSEQKVALRGMNQALAIPRSPWSSHSICRSTHKETKQNQ